MNLNDYLFTIQEIKDINNLPISDIEKCEIFYTTLYLFYRKIGVGMNQTKIMLQAVNDFSKKSNNEDAPFINNVKNLKKHISKWVITGEQLFNKLKKEGKLDKLPIFREYGIKYV